MKKRFYLMEQKHDGRLGTFLGTIEAQELGYDKYSEAVDQAKKEIRGRRKGKLITIIERRETFKAPPSDVVSDDYNAQ